MENKDVNNPVFTVNPTEVPLNGTLFIDKKKLEKQRITSIDGTDMTNVEEYAILDQILPNYVHGIKNYPHAKEEGLEYANLVIGCIMFGTNGKLIKHSGLFKDSKHQINDMDGVFSLTFKENIDVPYPILTSIGENVKAEVIRIDNKSITINTKFKGVLANKGFCLVLLANL